jgi:hypothetical protein
MNNNILILLAFLAEDSELIPYRKSLRQIAGSVTSTILLQQIIFRSKQKNWEPFYKFKEPCTHSLYKSGDSWTEELGFSRREFDTALKNIGTKIKTGMSKERFLETEHSDASGLVAYWTDNRRITWYQLNIRTTCTLLGKGAFVLYQKADSAFTMKSANPPLHVTESPETTTEKKPGKDPVFDIFNLQGQEHSENSAANPEDQYWHYRDKFLEIWQDSGRGYPKITAKEEIIDLSSEPDADPALWEKSIKEADMNFAGKGQPSLNRIINVYRSGGDYKAAMAIEFPETDKNGQEKKEFQTFDEGSSFYA